MKLATMKIVCLLTLIGGVYMLGLVFDIGGVQLVHERALEYWPRQESGALNLRMPGAIFGTVLALIGLYGLLPRLRRPRSATITFRGANGDITLQLRPIRKVLLKMMRRMPEVYSIKLDVRPDGDGRRACIDADVVLKNCAALGARQCARVVAECLNTTARGLLGLEELSGVRVNVAGVHLDVAATGKQIREQMAQRQTDAESGYAVARPPIAAVTLAEKEEAAAATEATAKAEAAAATAQTAGAANEEDAKTETAKAAGSQAVVETAQEPKPAQQHTENVPEAQAPLPDAPAQGVQEEITPQAEIVPQALTVPHYAAPGAHDEEIPEPETVDEAELPHLADRDVELPPAPKINEEGEITTDEVADRESETKDSVQVAEVMVDVLEPEAWSGNAEDLPEPAPEEMTDDPADTEIDPEEPSAQ